ncbi:MAG TPA: hypothetical protein VF868_13720 [Bacteroidia bacterium]
MKKRDMFNDIKILVIFALFAGKGFAQNFNYSFQKDSSEYTALAGGTIKAANESWVNKQFEIPLPFQFNFCGISTDSLFIEPNGFVVFDKRTQISIVAFNEFGSRADANQSFNAELKYSVEGTAGSRIIKVQYSNLSKNKHSSSDELNYQIWLFEAGNLIEIHSGPNSYADSRFDSPILIGLINKNMNSSPNGFLVGGDLNTAFAQSITGEELTYFNGIPSQGVFFRFTPSF